MNLRCYFLPARGMILGDLRELEAHDQLVGRDGLGLFWPARVATIAPVLPLLALAWKSRGWIITRRLGLLQWDSTRQLSDLQGIFDGAFPTVPAISTDRAILGPKGPPILVERRVIRLRTAVTVAIRPHHGLGAIAEWGDRWFLGLSFHFPSFYGRGGLPTNP